MNRSGVLPTSKLLIITVPFLGLIRRNLVRHYEEAEKLQIREDEEH